MGKLPNSKPASKNTRVLRGKNTTTAGSSERSNGSGAKEELDLGEIAQSIWRDLDDEDFPFDRVRQVTDEVAASFADSKIRTYVPVFIRKRALEVLSLKPASGE